MHERAAKTTTTKSPKKRSRRLIHRSHTKDQWRNVSGSIMRFIPSANDSLHEVVKSDTVRVFSNLKNVWAHRERVTKVPRYLIYRSKRVYNVLQREIVLPLWYKSRITIYCNALSRLKKNGYSENPFELLLAIYWRNIPKKRSAIQPLCSLEISRGTSSK